MPHFNLLDRFLKKRGVKSADELDNTPNTDGSPTERQVFESYERTLSKEEMTMDDLKTFLSSQIALIEARWKSFEISKDQKAELIPLHTVYKVIEQAISAPQAERAQLEALLNKLTQ